MSTEQKDRPDYKSSAYKGMAEDAKIMRDIVAGNRRIKAAGEEYLPRHSKEEHADYRVRLEMSVLFNGTERTVEGLTGMVFAKPPAYMDLPPAFEEHAQNIDNAGMSLDVFAKELFQDALTVGHVGILVEAPPVDQPDDRRLTQVEEAALGVRPYWCMYRKEDIISWRTEVVRGQTVLEQLVLREMVDEADGEYGTKEVSYYRVLRRNNGSPTWERFKVEDDKVMLEGNGMITNQTEIPFAVVYGKRTGLLESKPPLLDLAQTNLAHYRLTSDHLYKLHLCNLPVGVLRGVDAEQKIGIGPNTWLKLPDPDMDFKWESPDGSTFADNQNQLSEFKAEMAAQGLSMLQVETRAAETEAAKRMDKSESDAALTTAARSLQAGLMRAWLFHAQFMRVTPTVKVSVNRDYENVPLTPAEHRELRENVASGFLSLDTMWSIMQARGTLPENFDAAEERERIAMGIDA